MLIYMTDGEKIKENASKNITDRLVWNAANKNQAGIARDIVDGKAIPEAYGLGEAGVTSFLTSGSSAPNIPRILRINLKSFPHKARNSIG